MLKAAVVEDEQVYSEQITGYIDRFAKETRSDIRVTVFPSGDDLLLDYDHEWDIIFLDIAMPGTDGMSTAAKIRETDSSVILIFITSLAKYAIKGYEVEALDFILKPVSYQQFCMKMFKAVSAASSRKTRYVRLSVKDGEAVLSTDDIFYVEVRNHHLHIISSRGDLTVFESLNHFEKGLPSSQFSRCSQSFLVNLKHVEKVSSVSVIVKGSELPLSRSRKKEFLGDVSVYFGGTGL